ncbi:MAG: ribonuclease R, partial [Porticoccaceae bacterium]
GLIHVTGLPKDYYHHEASQHRMVGERTGRTFRLGQKVKVKVVRVNLEERKIDFELIDKGFSPSHNSKPRSSAKASDDRSNKTQGKKTRPNGSGGKKKPSKRSRAKAKSGSSSAKRRRKSKR